MLLVNLFARKRFKLFAQKQLYCFSNTNENKYNVMFFGTDNIAKTVLEALYLNSTKQHKNPVVDALEVTTAADIPGRKSINPVKIFCDHKEISKVIADTIIYDE